MSIKFRILITLIPAILILIGLLLFANYRSSQNILLNVINKEANETAKSRVMEFDIIFESSQKVAQGIAVSINTMPELSKSSIEELLIKTLYNNTSVYGSTTSFIPEASNLGKYAPYYYFKNKKLVYKSLTDTSYDYVNQNWFKTPINNNKGFWTQPYMDTGGGDTLMVTYSEPVYRKNQIIGVATVDISLENLLKRVKNMTVNGKGYAFLVTTEGYLIANPKYGVLSDKTIFEIQKDINLPGMDELVKTVTTPGIKFIELTDPFFKKSSVILKTTIPTIDWSLIIIYPSEEFLKPLDQLTSNIISISLVSLILIVGIILWQSSLITKPIINLVNQTKLYSQGDLTKQLNEKVGSKEIQELSIAFNKMGQAILEQIENVKITSAQKERYQQELEIAAEIQQSILPQTFPAFPELESIIDLYGITKPAREIGGDFYDFFRLSEDRIGLVIADVSDKGAPSSFFMAMARMLVREMALRKMSPSEVLRRTNFMLGADNQSCMFVTLIYAEYNLNTGYTRFACAGHNPPLHLTANGEVKVIKLFPNLPLGLMQDSHYKTNEYILNPGDTLLMYTDGITEAANADDKMLGMDKFKHFVENKQDLTIAQLSENLLKQIETFANEAEQLDDITILGIKRKISSEANSLIQKAKLHETISLTLPSNTNILEKLSALASSISADIGFDSKEIYQINLAIDEIVTNIIMHAYESNEKETLQIEFIPRIDGLQVSVMDHGMPFDFNEKINAYNDEASIEQPVGGVGLFLVKKSVDEIWYEPDTIEGNKVTFIKYIKTT